MASCECCWSSRDPIADSGYSDAMKAHEDRGCECTKPTMSGLRARAGQFWDEDENRDARYSANEWAALVAKLEPTHAAP